MADKPGSRRFGGGEGAAAHVKASNASARAEKPEQKQGASTACSLCELAKFQQISVAIPA
jgi:hypothetical protein